MRISDWSSDVCSSDLFAFIDIGKVRGPSDVFAIHGVKNYAAMATATRWVMGYDSGTLSGGSSGLSITATPAELYAAFQTHPRLEESFSAFGWFATSRPASRSEERRVGEGGGRTGRTRGW